MNRKIVFFDGVCALCDGFVEHLLSVDKNKVLLFAPLQGQAAKDQLPASLIENLSSIVFKDESNNIYTESDAVIHIYAAIGGMYAVAKIFFIVPKILRDKFYKYVAKNRYLWFGKRDFCKLPSASEKTRILP